MNDTLAPIRFVIALAVILMALGLVTAAFGEPAPVSVRSAIEQACRAQLGTAGTVDVAALESTVPDQPGLVARPEPGARTGAPARFVLWVKGNRVGYAVATVKAQAAVLRATRELPRDQAISAGDVVTVTEEVGDVAFKRLPGEQDVLGAHPRRTIAAGERVTSALVAVAPAVRSGDAVTATLRRGPVEVTGQAVASGSGHVGDVIRVRSTGNKRLLTARITAPGAVEVMQ